MAEQTTITLPSGRQWTYRKATVLDGYRIGGALPDLAAAQTPEGVVDRRESTRIGLTMICQLSVEPKFWADLRPDDEIHEKPRKCPEGCVELDLSHEDYVACIRALSEQAEAGVAETGPLPETAKA